MDTPAPDRAEQWQVLRAQMGDRASLERLLHRTAPWLRAYLRRVVVDEHLAEDVLQDALVQVFRKLGGLHEPRAYRVWVYRIASREALRAVRRREPAIREAAERVAPEQPTTISEEQRRGLDRAIQRLSANTRAVIVLHYCEGHSLRVVGAILGISPGTVKSRLHAGLRSLRAAAPGA